MKGWKWLKHLWMLALISAFPGTLLSFDGMPQLFGYRLLLIIHFILFGFALIWQVGQGQETKLSLPRIRAYLVFLALWLTWAAVSLLWAPSIFYGAKHLLFLLAGISLIYFTVYYFGIFEDLKLLMGINLGVLAFEIGLGLWELHTGFHIYGSFPNYYMRHNDLPVIGTFGHPNNYATYLSMYLPLLYVWTKYQKNHLVKIFCFVLLLLGCHLIISSTSRANMIAMVLGIFVAVGLTVMNYRFLSRKQFIIGIGLVFVATVFFLLRPVSQFVYQESTHFLEQVASVFTNWDQDGSIRVRKILIFNGLTMLKDYYGLGVGPGNSQFLMQEFMDETFGHVKLHNWWVEVLVDYGVLVWVLYLVFFVKMMRDLFRVFRRTEHPTLKMWSEGLMISLFAFSLGVVSNGSMISSPHMWILYGLVLCTLNVSGKKNY